MKAKIKFATLAAVSALAVFAATFNNAPIAVASSEVASPRSLYIQNCARCHGASGHSTPKGRSLEAPDLAGLGKGTDRITRIIRNGKGDMPAFGKRLSAAQIASIAAYAHSL
jgi:mono/diheme cytochrome c family protein